MKKILLNGAGLGKSALELWGNNNIYAFVDDMKKKQAEKFRDTPVLSFEEMLCIYKDFELIIASQNYDSIADRLEENSIYNYKIFMGQSLWDFQNYIKSNHLEEFNNITIYADNSFRFTKQIMEAFKSCGLEGNIKNIIQYSDETLSKKNLKRTTYPDLESVNETDCILIADYAVSDALEIKIANSKLAGAKVVNIFKISSSQKRSLVNNKYSDMYYDNSKEQSYNAYKLSQQSIHRGINAYCHEMYKKLPLPRLIEIEIINRCNGVCSFCPANKNVDVRPFKEMEEQVFYKIIDELSELNYGGSIDLFGNSEPLLSKNIVSYHKYLRGKLPKANILLFTNGTLLSVEIFEALLPYVDLIIIDNYQKDLKLIKPVEKIRDYCEEHPDIARKVRIEIRDPYEVLNTRAGKAPNRSEYIELPDVGCTTVFHSMMVRPTGEVSLCCNDAMGEVTLGDLSKQSIVDIWYGDEFDKARKLLMQGRQGIEICKNCDNVPIGKGKAW